MRTTARLLALFFLVPLPTLVAQVPEQLEPGQRIRVTAPELGFNKQVVTFDSWREDSLLIISDHPLPLRVGSVTKLEVSRARQSHVVLGMGVGFLAGAAVGAVAGSAAAEDADLRSEHAAAIGAGIFGAGGALVGALIGLNKSDRWEEVPLDRVRPEVIAQRRGFGLALSIAF